MEASEPGVSEGSPQNSAETVTSPVGAVSPTPTPQYPKGNTFLRTNSVTSTKLGGGNLMYFDSYDQIVSNSCHGLCQLSCSVLNRQNSLSIIDTRQ